jgi:uncharacterized protein DUF3883
LPWSTEEVILAMALYQDILRVPEEYDPKVTEIARAIGRTPDAVVYKIANLRFLLTQGARGFKHTARTDRMVCKQFRGKDAELKMEAEKIRTRLLVEPEEAVREIQKAAQGQGFLKSAVERKRIEAIAMNKAIHHFGNLGYHVEDVHAHMPCDLKCTKAEEVLYVEVKGTTGLSDKVLLTGGEVRFAKNHPKMALFVVYSISLLGKDNQGAPTLILNPWILDESRLLAYSYLYELGGN